MVSKHIKAVDYSPHHLVIIGSGFGGLHAAQTLKRAPVKIPLIDKRNFHLFQPLLYQVATGELSPGDTASPLRAILNRQKNTLVLQAEAVDVNPARQTVILRDGKLSYNTLIVATGVSHHYFSHDITGGLGNPPSGYRLAASLVRLRSCRSLCS